MARWVKYLSCQHPYEQDWLPWHLPYLQQVGAQVGFVGQAGWPEALGSIYKVGYIGSVYKVESDCVSASGLHKHVHMNTRVPGHTCTHTHAKISPLLSASPVHTLQASGHFFHKRF